MIEINGLSKFFDKQSALNSITLNVNKASILGLTGSNGAGKSTLLRLIAGIFQPDQGSVYINGSAPFENFDIKKSILYIPDTPQSFKDATIDEMARYYSALYSEWNQADYQYNLNLFSLNPKMIINKMSKGKQRQSAIAIALAANPQYLLLDEVFDGLDPTMRKLVKEMLINSVSCKDTTIVIASHNLRELDELCDSICLLHQGKRIFLEDMDELKQKYYRVRVVFQNNEDFDSVGKELSVTQVVEHGRSIEFLALGNKNRIDKIVLEKQPLVYEPLPLTIEEIVIYNMEVLGYDVKTPV